MPTGIADVTGTPNPETVEWPYLKKFVKPKNKKSNKDSIVRRAMSKAVKEEKEVNEVIDMNNQVPPQNWLNAKRMWNKLIDLKKVYPTDHEGLITFERFYSSFIKKYDKEPSLDDVIDHYLGA